MVSVGLLRVVLAAGCVVLGQAVLHDAAETLTAFGTTLTVVMIISLYYIFALGGKTLRAYTNSVMEAVTSISIAVDFSEGLRHLNLLLFRPRGLLQKRAVYIGCCLESLFIVQGACLCLSWKRGTSSTHGMDRRMVLNKAFGATCARFLAFAFVNLFLLSPPRFSTITAVNKLLHFCISFGVWVVVLCFTCSVRLLVVHWDKSVDEREEEWEKYAQQFEIDCAGLCQSVLLVETGLASIGHGEQLLSRRRGRASFDLASGSVAQTWGRIAVLLALAVTAKLSGIGADKVCAAYMRRANENPGAGGLALASVVPRWMLLRTMLIAVNTLHKAAGWFLLHTIIWVTRRSALCDRLFEAEQEDVGDMVSFRAVTACSCTYIGFSIMIVLNMFSVEHVAVARRSIVQMVSMMVGFAWRRYYGAGMDELSFAYLKYFQPQDLPPNGAPPLIQPKTQLLFAMATEVSLAVALLPILYWQMTPQAIMSERALAPSSGDLAAATNAENKHSMDVRVMEMPMRSEHFSQEDASGGRGSSSDFANSTASRRSSRRSVVTGLNKSMIVIPGEDD